MSLQVPEANGLNRSRSVSKQKKEKVTYETVQHGIEQLYPAENSTTPTNTDVVFVPGLGANPKESWKSTKTDFNWASDTNGIQKDFPNARVLLYMYESAFHGTLQVEQFMDNIASGLLYALQSKRGKDIQRPLVFIGHSMGGLVIAKALTIMDLKRDIFQKMYEATAGCIFFGSPFNGAPAANVAAMFAYYGEKFGQATASKLLDLMKPGDANLAELRGDFHHLVSKVNPNIELFCFWEEHETDIVRMATDVVAKLGGQRLAGTLNEVLRKARGSFKIVDRESATFGNVVKNLGLACNHRDLVKFDHFKDPRYQMVREPLKRVIHGAPLTAKNRLNSIRDIDLNAIKSITKALEPTFSPISRKAVAQRFSSSSWLPTDKEFCEWLARDSDPHDSTHKKREDCLWVCGAQGRGKTGASIAALEEIEKAIKGDKHVAAGKAPILLVYYFCDPSAASTAEDLLKYLLLQLIQQQHAFLSYAKQFAEMESETDKKQRKRAVPKSVENLWQSLQDMLSDNTAASRIYFVINNLHSLPQESESTKKFLDLLKTEIETTMTDEELDRISARWMFTTRKTNKKTSEIVDNSGVRVIDLEDEKYADQVQLELRKHAHRRVSALGAEKNYKKDLVYFVSSLIGNRAQTTGWIDLTCGQLEEIPDTEDPLRVRQTLKKLPQQLDDLLDDGWNQIFNSNPAHAEKIKDLLQVLILTYEDPSITELALLAGFSSEDECIEELRDLVARCKSFLILQENSDAETEPKVCFKHNILKPHLKRRADALMGISQDEIRWTHGEMALRSFSHLMERFDIPEPEPAPEPESIVGDVNGSIAGGQEVDDDEEKGIADDEKSTTKEDEEEEHDNEDEDDNNDDEQENDNASERDSDGDTLSPEKPEITALPYMVKHWLHHASNSTAEMAEQLSLEEAFWKPDSPIFKRWLAQYNYLTHKFMYFEPMTMKALHIASSVGYRQLVTALIKNGHENELNEMDSLENIPLHLAAAFGRQNIVEELILRGSPIDHGKENFAQTPLSMATGTEGSIKVMKMLFNAGADPNTVDSNIGGPLNFAILSGNLEAVKLLVEKGASVSPPPDDRFEPPLTYAAYRPDSGIFDYLMKVGEGFLTPSDYDRAFIGAAFYGNVEVLRKLLGFEHEPDTLQTSLEAATKECEWEIVRVILERYPGLNCDDLFYALATGWDDQDELLDVVWNYTNGSISAEHLNNSLYHATDNEKEATVKYLVDTCKADPDASGEVYGNALTAAAYDGTLTMLRMLLDAGAHINHEEGYALQAAAGQGHEEVVLELLGRGADVNAVAKNEHFRQATALQAAVEAGRPDIVKVLLEHKADPDIGGGELTCPIIAATTKAEEEILELLVKHGAKTNVFGGYDNTTPLINAAIYMPKESLQILLTGGADINLADEDSDTALIMAAYRGDSDSVEFLLEHGANALAISNVRGNALQAAHQGQDMDCIGLLIEHVSKLLKEGTYAQLKESQPVKAEVEPPSAAPAVSVGEPVKEDHPAAVELAEATKQAVATNQDVSSYVGNVYSGQAYGGHSYASNGYDDKPHTYGVDTRAQPQAYATGSENSYPSAYLGNDQSYAANTQQSYGTTVQVLPPGQPTVDERRQSYAASQLSADDRRQSYAASPPSAEDRRQSYAPSPQAYPGSPVSVSSQAYPPETHGSSSHAHATTSFSPSAQPEAHGSQTPATYPHSSPYGATSPPANPHSYGAASPPVSTMESGTRPPAVSSQSYGPSTTTVPPFASPNRNSFYGANPHRATSFAGPYSDPSSTFGTPLNRYPVQAYNPNASEEQYGGPPSALRVGYGASPPPLPISRKPVPGQGAQAQGQGGYANLPGYQGGS